MDSISTTTERMTTLYHKHNPKPKQCSSTLTQIINSPLAVVWSILRRFDQPQVYKRFIKKCTMLTENVREVEIVSGLPAEFSWERLDDLDDDTHVIKYTMIDGDHRLLNYQSITTVHEEEKGGTVLIESYLVDVPHGNTEEETRVFINTVVGLNHKSLAKVAENN